METVRLALHAPDPLTRAGLVHVFRLAPAVRLVRPGDAPDVRVMVCSRFCGDVASSLEAEFGPPVVLVVDRIAERDLPLAVAARVVSIQRRNAVSAERLVQEVRVAAAFAASRANPLARRYLRKGVRLEGDRLSLRELDVLSLMAEGLGTREIAEALQYSERLVKQLTHRIFVQLGRRNRSHAVAYALRSGLI